MARVSDWFTDFAIQLIERSGRGDFPELGTEFWCDFEKSLVRIGATFAQADAASSSVCDLPDVFPSQYRGLVVQAVQAIQAREAVAARGVPAGSRQEAEIASRECPECLGSGWSTRFIHAEVVGRMRAAGGNDLPAGCSVASACGSCQLGRFQAAANSTPERPCRTWADSPEFRFGPVPWSDRPDNRYAHRPESWDHRHDRPLEVAPPTKGLRDLVVRFDPPTRHVPTPHAARPAPDEAPKPYTPF
jgi:hypothetical protein